MAATPDKLNGGWASFSETDLDLNASFSFTAWDVSDYGALSISLVNLSTTPSADLEVTVRFSPDGSHFDYTSYKLKGSSYGLGVTISTDPIVIDVTNVRYVMLATTVANGSALTGDAIGIASNLPGKDLRVADGPVRPTTLLYTLEHDNCRSVSVRGSNSNFAASRELVSTRSSGLYDFPSSAETLYAVSSSSNDTAAGAGARTVTVEGLDASGNEITETISMNGTSNTSNTSASFLRVNRFYVDTCGTYHTTGNSGINAGSISLYNSSSGDLLSYIPLRQSAAYEAVYTIPAGYTGYLHSLSYAPSDQTSLNIDIWKRENITDTTAPVSPKTMLWTVARAKYYANIHNFFEMPVLPALTDVWAEAIGATGNATAASIEMNLLLRKN